MESIVVILGIIVVGLIITEVVVKKFLINISDKIVDIIEALNKKYK